MRPVANCRYCGAETELISFGEPICASCDRARTKEAERKLAQEDQEASLEEGDISIG